MATPLVTMLKTYAGDHEYVARLVPTYRRHNIDSLPLYIVVPKADLSLFAPFADDNTFLIADEDVTTDYLSLDQAKKIGAGFGIANAGVVKLAFGLLGIADNYFAIDSDTVFIRDFGTSDFLDPSGTPYLIADAYPDLASDPFYSRRYWASRSAAFGQVLNTLGVEEPLNRTSLCSQVLASECVESLMNHLAQRGMTFADAMYMSIYEFFWYGAWALSQRSMELRRDFVKVVHHQGEHLSLHLSGVRSHTLASSYLGVIVNSNWSRQYGIVDFDDPPIERYLSEGSWAEWLRSQPAPNFSSWCQG